MSTLYLPVDVLWSRIEARTRRNVDNCLEWQGATTSRGYGSIFSGKRGKSELTHRIAVLASGREIPDGLTVDHLCRNKVCVNPEHLEVVTIAENSRRGRIARGHREGGRCGKGHLLAGPNLYRHPRGQLVCRECARRHRVEAKARRAVATAA